MVVDLDIETFFDRVNHDILMGLLAQRVADRRILRLVRGFLTCGVLADGLVGPTDEGTPQGGPLRLGWGVARNRRDKRGGIPGQGRGQPGVRPAALRPQVIQITQLRKRNISSCASACPGICPGYDLAD